MITKLKIKCEKHGTQLAVVVFGGEVWCKECQKEYQETKKILTL